MPRVHTPKMLPTLLSGGFFSCVRTALERCSCRVRTTLAESAFRWDSTALAVVCRAFCPRSVRVNPPLARGCISQLRIHVVLLCWLCAVRVSLVWLRLARLSLLCSTCVCVFCSVCAFLTVLQLTTDRAIATIRTKLYGLNGTRETVERIACALVLTVELLDGPCIFFCAFIQFLLIVQQFATDVLVHRLVGVVYLLGLLSRLHLTIGYPGDSSTYAARWDSPLQYVHDCVCHRLSSPFFLDCYLENSFHLLLILV